jgi:hypothetical protein
LQAVSAPHSGQTSAVKAMRWPSGDQVGVEIPPDTSVFFSGSPPATGISQSCASPERVERKAMVRPSGENCGDVSLASEVVRRRGSPPEESTRQRWTVCLPVRMSEAFTA